MNHCFLQEKYHRPAVVPLIIYSGFRTADLSHRMMFCKLTGKMSGIRRNRHF